jgi:predicted transposase/invertase (TIGR01784 family)
MQMEWSSFFCSRLLFNASKAFVRQLRRGESFGILQPVYGVGIINEDFDRETPEFYHRYQLMNAQNSNDVISGMELVLVELPKFEPKTWADRRMAVLWLRFLKEVNDQTKEVSEDLLADENIRKALDICKESGFTEEELYLYDHYWDAISTEKAALATSRAEGEAIGRAKGKTEGKAEIAVRCALKGMSPAEIADLTSLPVDEVYAILKQNKS